MTRIVLLLLLLLFGCSSSDMGFNASESAYLEAHGYGPFYKSDGQYEHIELRDSGLYRTWIYMTDEQHQRGCDVYIWRETSGTDRWIPVRRATCRNVTESVVFVQRWLRENEP